ncbi:MAG: hypothetical protein IIB28_08385 [Chloroflexi bacterium]|nr:hypothetical protein [Chloroflexota bacterium]
MERIPLTLKEVLLRVGLVVLGAAQFALIGLAVRNGALGIGPAIGRVMADLVVGRDPGHDLARFRPQRFFDGGAIVPGPY